MNRLPLLENLNESISVEDVNIGDTILINHGTSGKIEVQIGNIIDNDIFWSTADGKMGRINSNNVLKIVKLEDLRSKYFEPNSKFSQFRVPLEIFKETDKAILAGYIDEHGRQQAVWMAKKLVTSPWKNSHNIAGIPKDSYNLANLIFYDKEKEDFFKYYAGYIHSKATSKDRTKFSDKWSAKRGTEEKSLKNFQKLLKFYDPSISVDSIEPMDFEKSHYVFHTNIGDINTWLYHYPSLRLGTELYYITDYEFESDSANAYKTLFEVFKNLGYNSKNLTNKLLSYYKELYAGYDPDFNMIDDGRKWRGQNSLSTELHKLKTIANTIGLANDIKKIEDSFKK